MEDTMQVIERTLNELDTTNFQTLPPINLNDDYSLDVRELVKSLALARQDFDDITKDKVNPHFRSAYASLDSIIPAVDLDLAKHGLIVVQLLKPFNNELQFFTTKLIHGESGQHISSTVTIPTLKTLDSKVLQAFGSNITYLRRYMVVCMLFLCTGEGDDDGESATAPLPVAVSNGSVAKVSVTPKQAPKSITAPTGDTNDNGEAKADKEDFIKLKKTREELEISQEEAADILKGMGISRPSEIPKSMVDKVIENYREYDNARQ
jgi:hypothetical protein